MIKLVLRLLPSAFSALTAPSLDPFESHASRFRVLPHDIDLNFHLNNGRYLQLLDLNRLEWLLRTGILQKTLRAGWKPILGSNAIQFRRELRLWDRGVMRTRLAGWDDRWFFLEHRIETLDGRCVALSLAKAAFRSRGEWVSTSKVIEQVGFERPRMALAPHIEAWRALDTSVLPLM